MIKLCVLCGEKPEVEEFDSTYYLRCSCGRGSTSIYRNAAIMRWNAQADNAELANSCRAAKGFCQESVNAIKSAAEL